MLKRLFSWYYDFLILKFVFVVRSAVKLGAFFVFFGKNLDFVIKNLYFCVHKHKSR